MGPADEYAHMIDQCFTAKIEKYEYKVGLYELNSVDTWRLQAPGFQPLSQ
jgi:hypothetical protein